ncbi:MAG: M20/M25/M40 family metallo-hydrolase [Planctomycetota bacterium]
MTRLVKEPEALRTVMALLRIDGVTGKEGAVASFIKKELGKAGVPSKTIRTDRAHKSFPFPAESGNVIAELAGRGDLAGAKPLLFCAHMDTVAIAAGARPVRKGRFVVPKGKTALGADDRSGCAALLTLAKTLKRTKADHPPLVLLFTAAEETGLWGSRFVDARALKKCAMGFSYDGGDPAVLAVAAPSSDIFTVEIEGAAAHAGGHPEKGISAGTVFARATARLDEQGWLGKITKGRERGTSNIGVVEGGAATNIVMPALSARGEARSYSATFLEKIIRTIRNEFVRAASRARNDAGRRAKVKFKRTPIYRAFDLGDDAPVVEAAKRAAKALGLKAKPRRQFGGLDANWLNAHCPVVTLGAGAMNPHQPGEKLDVRQYLLGCEMAVRLAVGEG